jgi:methionine sulfoxide reductase heme-binding subunit
VNSTYLWYTTRASGIVTLILLTLTMVLGLATTNRVQARSWPGFAQQEIHRRISILAVIFLAIHVLTSILDTFVHIGWPAVVVPFTSPYSRFWVGLGTVALDLMLAVFISSLLRSRLKPGTWRGAVAGASNGQAEGSRPTPTSLVPLRPSASPSSTTYRLRRRTRVALA